MKRIVLGSWVSEWVDGIANGPWLLSRPVVVGVWRIGLWVLSCCFIPLAACRQATTPQKPPPQDEGVSHAVVQLLAVGPANQGQNQECSATAFLINEDGYLITNWHVVEAAKGCLEKAPGAKILAKLAVSNPRTAQAVPCDVVALDKPNDLALLRIERPLLPGPGDKPVYAALDSRTVAVGMAARVSGYPAFAWQPVTQSGMVLWIGRTLLEETDDPLPSPSDAIEINIHLRSGNSGSPVYRPGGGVIAVVDKRNALRPEYSFAVSIHYAIELAEGHGVRWHRIE